MKPSHVAATVVPRPHVRTSLAWCAVLLACGSTTSSIVDATGMSTDGSGTAPSMDLAAPDLPSAGRQIRWVSAGVLGPCVVLEPDGRIECREPSCDEGRDPQDWDLEDATCWVATAIEPGEYARVEAKGGERSSGYPEPLVCGLRADATGIACDPPIAALPPGVYSELGMDSNRACALSSSGMHCVSVRGMIRTQESDAIALRRSVVRFAGGISSLWYMENFGPTWEQTGSFVEATGSEFVLCGRTDAGSWVCTDPEYAEQLDEIGPITDLEIATLGPEPQWSGCGLDASAAAVCWGGIPHRDGPFRQLTAAGRGNVGEETLALTYACGVLLDGTLSCWGPVSAWCGEDICAEDYWCLDPNRCLSCGPGGCESCGAVDCGPSDTCIESGICRPCGAGKECSACECTGSLCDAELSLCLCGAECIDGSCRLPCAPDGLVCHSGSCSGVGVNGECVDGYCVE